MLNKFFAAAGATGVSALLLATFVTQGFGSSVEAGSRQREAAATKFVDQKLRIWQERMNLKDWDIRVQLVRATALEPRTLGNIHWDTVSKVATIDVLSSLDYQLPYNAMLADMEFTVVHELVHLELASLPRSDASRRVEERAVNEIATALLKLARNETAN
jgi:hypothetical protein